MDKIYDSWYRRWDIEYDECERNWYRENNHDDQDRIFLLKNDECGHREGYGIPAANRLLLVNR